MARRPIAWSPQPGPQHKLVTCPVYEIFYGGARGGGKTDGMLGKFAIKASRYGKDVTGVFFRKTRVDLKEAIERSHQIYNPVGAVWHDQKNYWRFPNGARLKFEYLERDRDAENYQGHNYTDLFFEELTHWESPEPINKLRATLRSATGIPAQFHATGNPGGPGHNWVKARYIDPAPQGFKILKEEYKNPFTGEMQTLERVFIPAKLTDNQLLMAGDPLYVAKLQQLGNEQLVKAWLEGDWSIIDGAYFDCWSDRMVLEPFTIPKDWVKFRSFDWGSAKPFSVGWWAIAQDSYKGIPRGALVRYREWYGSEKSNNVGLKLTAEEVADGISMREDEEISYSVADPAIFSEDGGPSLAERMGNRGIYWRKADNKRVAGRGQLGGWDQMRNRMKGEEGAPMIYCFNTCTDSIRTIPVLQHDERKPEDLDTSAEDHAADEWRYACMSRPWSPNIEQAAREKHDSYWIEESEEDTWLTV